MIAKKSNKNSATAYSERKELLQLIKQVIKCNKRQAENFLDMCLHTGKREITFHFFKSNDYRTKTANHIYDMVIGMIPDNEKHNIISQYEMHSYFKNGIDKGSKCDQYCQQLTELMSKKPGTEITNDVDLFKRYDSPNIQHETDNRKNLETDPSKAKTDNLNITINKDFLNHSPKSSMSEENRNSNEIPLNKKEEKKSIIETEHIPTDEKENNLDNSSIKLKNENYEKKDLNSESEEDNNQSLFFSKINESIYLDSKPEEKKYPTDTRNNIAKSMMLPKNSQDLSLEDKFNAFTGKIRPLNAILSSVANHKENSFKLQGVDPNNFKIIRSKDNVNEHHDAITKMFKTAKNNLMISTLTPPVTDDNKYLDTLAEGLANKYIEIDNNINSDGSKFNFTLVFGDFKGNTASIVNLLKGKIGVEVDHKQAYDLLVACIINKLKHKNTEKYQNISTDTLEQKLDIAYIAYQPAAFSWNHSKVMLNDAGYSAVGGQNMFNEYNTGDNNVRDLTIMVENTKSTAVDLQTYLNMLIQETHSTIYPKNEKLHEQGHQFEIETEDNSRNNIVENENITQSMFIPATSNINHKVISGFSDIKAQVAIVPTYGQGYGGKLNYSKELMLSAIDDAKPNEIIRISQQSILFMYGLNLQYSQDTLSPYSAQVQQLLGKKIAKGCKVEILISPEGYKTKEGAEYEGMNIDVLKSQILDYASKHEKSDSDLSTKIEIKAYCPTHSKLVIIGDRFALVGSHNLYDESHAECTIAIQSESLVKNLINGYWQEEFHLDTINPIRYNDLQLETLGWKKNGNSILCKRDFSKLNLIGKEYKDTKILDKKSALELIEKLISRIYAKYQNIIGSLEQNDKIEIYDAISRSISGNYIAGDYQLLCTKLINKDNSDGSENLTKDDLYNYYQILNQLIRNGSGFSNAIETASHQEIKDKFWPKEFWNSAPSIKSDINTSFQLV